MSKRILAAIPVLIIAIGSIVLHGWYLKAVIIVFALIAEYEILIMIGKTGSKPSFVLGYFFTVALFAAILFLSMSMALIVIAISVIIVLMILIFNKNTNLQGMIKTIVTLIYPQLFFAFFLIIADYKDENLSRLLVLIVVATAAGTDTFAYFTGKFLGKKKLIPRISPKKTIAGAIGGVTGAVVLIALVGLFLQEPMKIDVPFYHFIILGVILSVLSQIGDLSASIIKRNFNTKDFGDIIPGHGGILDRLDSIIFICPVVYVYSMFFIF